MVNPENRSMPFEWRSTMVGRPIDDLCYEDRCELAPTGMIPQTFLGEKELTGFARLIGGRRPLPLYFGDCWRCYACTFECFDFFDMVDHIFKAHDAAPLDEDFVEDFDDDYEEEHDVDVEVEEWDTLDLH
jgi:hypothetical protein